MKPNRRKCAKRKNTRSSDYAISRKKHKIIKQKETHYEPSAIKSRPSASGDAKRRKRQINEPRLPRRCVGHARIKSSINYTFKPFKV